MYIYIYVGFLSVICVWHKFLPLVARWDPWCWKWIEVVYLSEESCYANSYAFL